MYLAADLGREPWYQDNSCIFNDNCGKDSTRGQSLIVLIDSNRLPHCRMLSDIFGCKVSFAFSCLPQVAPPTVAVTPMHPMPMRSVSIPGNYSPMTGYPQMTPRSMNSVSVSVSKLANVAAAVRASVRS